MNLTTALGLQKHFDNNEALRNAANQGIITNEQYNRMGGYDFSKTTPYGRMAPASATGIGSLAYNLIQSIRGNQPFSEIAGDVSRNIKGAMGNLTDEEINTYNQILSGGYENYFDDMLPNIPMSSNFTGKPVDPGIIVDQPMPKEGILSKFKSGLSRAKDLFLEGTAATGGLNIGARLGMMINPALALPGGIIGAFLGSKATRMGPSGSQYESLSDEQQDYIDQIYGPGGIMQGYNKISMFGKGPLGAMDKRIAQITKTLKDRDSQILQDRLTQLKIARDRAGGTIRNSSGQIVGYTGRGVIGGDSNDRGDGSQNGYGGTGTSSPSAVSSFGTLGGGV